MQDGATRQIAYYRGRGDLERVYSTVVSSLELTAVAGIVCGIVMYAAAGLLADVFGMPQLGGVVRIFAIGVLFFAAIRVRFLITWFPVQVKNLIERQSVRKIQC